MINWEAVFAKYKEVSGIYPHTECGNEESIAKALAWLIKD